MTSAAPRSTQDYQTLVATTIAGAERWIAEKEAARARLAEHLREVDADVQQAAS